MTIQTEVATLDKYKAFKEEGRELLGTIRMVKYDAELDTDVLMLDFDGVLAYVTREEFDIRDIKTSFVPYVGRKIKVVVKDVLDEKGLVICSRKMVLDKKRHDFILNHVNGEEAVAKITKFMNFGAYVEVDGVSLLLQNQHFAEDYTAISEVKNIGDTVRIKLLRVTDQGNLFAEAVEKHVSDTVVNLDMFERDQVVIGTIRNIKPFGVFVCIAPNLDALCPNPEDVEIEVGQKVQFRITKVDTDKEKVRGKILRVLPEKQEEEIL